MTLRTLHAIMEVTLTSHMRKHENTVALTES